MKKILISITIVVGMVIFGIVIKWYGFTKTSLQHRENLVSATMAVEELNVLKKEILNQEDKVIEFKKVQETIKKAKTIIYEAEANIEARDQSGQVDHAESEEAENEYANISEEIDELELKIASLKYLEGDQLVRIAAEMDVVGNPFRKIYSSDLKTENSDEEIEKNINQLRKIINANLMDAKARRREIRITRAMYVDTQQKLKKEQEILRMMKEKFSTLTKRVEQTK